MIVHVSLGQGCAFVISGCGAWRVFLSLPTWSQFFWVEFGGFFPAFPQIGSDEVELSLDHPSCFGGGSVIGGVFSISGGGEGRGTPSLPTSTHLSIFVIAKRLKSMAFCSTKRLSEGVSRVGNDFSGSRSTSSCPIWVVGGFSPASPSRLCPSPVSNPSLVSNGSLKNVLEVELGRFSLAHPQAPMYDVKVEVPF